MTSLIGSIKAYLESYSGLKANAPVWVDLLGVNPGQYAVIPLPGTRIVEKYIDGSSLREFPFAVQSVESTSDELERLEIHGFFEALGDWFESQTEAGTLPTLSANKTPESIEVTSWAFLYEQGVSDKGIYQVQCKLVYKQSA